MFWLKANVVIVRNKCADELAKTAALTGSEQDYDKILLSCVEEKIIKKMCLNTSFSFHYFSLVNQSTTIGKQYKIEYFYIAPRCFPHNRVSRRNIMC